MPLTSEAGVVVDDDDDDDEEEEGDEEEETSLLLSSSSCCCCGAALSRVENSRTAASVVRALADRRAAAPRRWSSL